MEKIKQHKEKIIGLLITLVFIALICWNLDFKQLIETFKIFNYKILILFIPLYVLSLYLRGVRWKYLLCGDKRFTIKESFLVFTAGSALNSYLPARAGDLWRAFHTGKKLDESKMKILGSIILERLIDGVSILLILAFAVLTYFKHPWVLNITYIASGIFLGGLIVFFCNGVERRAVVECGHDAVGGLLRCFHVCSCHLDLSQLDGVRSAHFVEQFDDVHRA